MTDYYHTYLKAYTIVRDGAVMVADKTKETESEILAIALATRDFQNGTLLTRIKFIDEFIVFLGKKDETK